MLKNNECLYISLKITLAYVIIGSIWIAFTDKFLLLYTKDSKIITLLSIVKGWLYVAVTAVILLVLMKKAIYRAKYAEKKALNNLKILKSMYNQLEAAHNEIALSQTKLQTQNEEMQEIQAKLLESEERYKLAIEGSNDIFWYTYNQNGKIYFDIRKTKELLGYSSDEIENTYEGFKTIIHPDDAKAFDTRLQKHLAGQTPYYECEYRLRHKEGNYIWFLSRGKAILDNQGQIVKMAGCLADINLRKEYEARISYLAYYDKLTDLPNRSKLEICIDETAASAEKAAILLIDLDNFRVINDLYSHSFGDVMLKNIGEVLTQAFKNKGQIYRLEGDVFALLLPDLDNTQEILETIKKIKTIFELPWNFNNQNIYTPVSIGVSLFPDHGTNSYTLLVNANLALFYAKEDHRNRYCIFRHEFNEVFIRKTELYSDLKKAIDNNEFIVFYQPQVDLKTNRIMGFEALVRWRHPQKGLIMPDSFIPVAEDTGLIVHINKLVMKEAFSQIKQWEKEGLGSFSISINFSAQNLQQPDLDRQIMKLLQENSLEPGKLEIEITETCAINDINNTIILLNKLKSMGIKIALDDFGMGYSSLNYLTQLPIDIVKIDKSFINSIFDDLNKQFIVEAVVGLAHKFSMKVVAEGVETVPQLEYTQKIECDKVQGYLFSKPVPAESIENVFANINIRQ
ncbi:MAG: EAL domain-containing protein [Bacillota bacterium]|nr:EAL domain-containing protein [Bacillota bacterium]